MWPWDRERRRFSPLVDVERCRRLTLILAQVQLEGDIATLIESQSLIQLCTALTCIVVPFIYMLS